MRNHHNPILGQRQIRLDGIASDLDSAFERRHGILGVFALVASMGNDLWCWVWCVGIWLQSERIPWLRMGWMQLDMRTLRARRHLRLRRETLILL